MAMHVVSSAAGIRPTLCSVGGGSLSTRFRARCFLLQRADVGKNRQRVSCAGADRPIEWRRECRELRVEIHELRGALADAWMQDEMSLLELEKQVSLLVGMYACDPVRKVNFDQASDQDCEVSAASTAIAREEDEADVTALPQLERIAGADELYKDAVILSERRSEGLRAKQEGLSTLRRLKKLNVHEYLHSALQASHLRSWLKSRGIAE